MIWYYMATNILLSNHRESRTLYHIGIKLSGVIEFISPSCVCIINKAIIELYLFIYAA